MIPVMSKVNVHQILLIVCGAVTVLADVDPQAILPNAEHWCYDEDTTNCGPKSWPGICRQGKFQSPIDIVPSDIVGSAEVRMPVKLSKSYCELHEGFFVENNGHTVQVTFPEDSRDSPSFYIEPGQAFPHKYEFAQLHIHWGPKRGHGSEHIINGNGYVMEMHIVHKRPAGSESNSSQINPDAHDLHDSDIAVISVFFKATDGAINYALEPIIEAAIDANGTAEGDRKVFKRHPLDLYALFPADKTVFQYHGSLTTPPCTQTVWWTLFESPVRISHEQVDTLLSLNSMEHKHITGNFRAKQPLYGRKVQHRTLEFSEFCEKEAGKYFQRIATGIEPNSKDISH